METCRYLPPSTQTAVKASGIPGAMTGALADLMEKEEAGSSARQKCTHDPKSLAQDNKHGVCSVVLMDRAVAPVPQVAEPPVKQWPVPSTACMALCDGRSDSISVVSVESASKADIDEASYCVRTMV